MPAGRPPKPIEQKRLLGNPGKRPLPEPVVVLPMAGEVPTPPERLGLAGREFWGRAWGRAIAWLSPDSDMDVIVMLCEAMDERAQLREVVLVGRRAEDRKELRALEKQITEWLSKLGFTPTDRSRLGVAEVKKANALDELQARRSERRG